MSDAARLYDPLGLIGPVIVMAKCFLQVLWEKKVDWDEPLEEEREEEEKRYDEFEQRRFELTVLLKRREAEMCVSNTKAQEYAVPNTDAQDPRESNPKSKVCLLEISLPNVDGALESWPTFRDAFSSMIDGHPGLSDADKLIYLQRVVFKEAHK